MDKFNKLKNWKHEKEFDTKTLFSDISSPEESSAGSPANDRSEALPSSAPKGGTSSSGRVSTGTSKIADLKDITDFQKQNADGRETQIYEPRPLTPEDDIYEDILEHFASAPTKPKYWFEELGDYWSCSCGHINKGDRCKNCGLERDLLRSLFILHKPAGAPGQLDKKLKNMQKLEAKEEKEEKKEERKQKKQQKKSLLVQEKPTEPAKQDIEPEPSGNSTDQEIGSPKRTDTESNQNEPAETAESTSAQPSDPKQPTLKQADTKQTSADQETKEPTEPSQANKEHPEENALVPIAADQKQSTDLSKSDDSALQKPHGLKRIFQKKNKLVIIIVAAILAILLVGVCGSAAYVHFAAPAIKYDEACQLQADGKYQKAITRFEDLGDYKDSKKRIRQCYISIGDEYYLNKQFQEALDTYNIAYEMKKTKKLKEKIRQCYISMGDVQYENGEYETALATYATALDLGDDSELQEKINRTKFAYVKANMAKRTSQVVEYMNQLMEISYPGIQEIYDEYYAWHVKIIANTTEEDLSTDLETASRNDTVYFHSTLSGGEPSEEIELYYEITWPNGSTQIYNLDSTWKSGATITARFQYPIPLFGSEGKLTFKLYDKSTNEMMGSDAITFEK